MLQKSTPDTPVGVIIGRFQTHELTTGHHQLLETVRSHHNKIIVMLGSCPTVRVTRNNPLDYQTRMLMLQQALPGAMIMPIRDMPSDEDWSKEVDSRIESVVEGISDERGATIYGSRDAFIPHYNGKYHVVELDPAVEISATQIRQIISDEVKESPDFRRGVIYAACNQYPRVMPTVDIACLKVPNTHKPLLGNPSYEVALVRKKIDIAEHWRFPGGFLDPRKDDGIEETAAREIREETGLEIGDLRYVRSFKVDDWRYRKEIDKIFTSLFVCKYVYGGLRADDDVHRAEWFPIDMEDPDKMIGIMIPEHRILMSGLIAHLEKEHAL